MILVRGKGSFLTGYTAVVREFALSAALTRHKHGRHVSCEYSAESKTVQSNQNARNFISLVSTLSVAHVCVCVHVYGCVSWTGGWMLDVRCQVPVNVKRVLTL